MKQLLTAIFILLSLSSYSQGGTFNAGGKLVSANSDSALTVGQQISLTIDTTKKFGLATINGNLWFFDRNVGYWKVVNGGSGIDTTKVNKWERWTDTFFIQKYDTTKTALTIRIDTNLTSKPTFQILDSINRPLFEMRAGNKRFDAENIFFGLGSGQKLRPVKYNSATYGIITGGSINTAFGNHALENAVDANENAAFGVYALQNLIGGNGGDPLLDGALNTALGAWSGRFMTTGTANVLIGQKSGNQITTGGYNVMAGKSVGEGIKTGGWNVLLGSEVGKFMDSTAVFNTWIGTTAGKNNKGRNSILLGAGSGANYDTYNEMVVGAVPDGGANTSINDVWFGQGKFSPTPTNYIIHGTRGQGTNINGGDVSIAGGEMSGNGTSGKVLLKIAVPVFSGTQQGYLVDAVKVEALKNTTLGAMGINSDATHTLTVANKQTNRNASDTVVYISNTGASYQWNGVNKTSVGMQIDSKAFNLQGIGTLTNIAIKATASRGDANIAIAADSGNVVIGDTTTVNRFHVKNGKSVFDWGIETPNIRLKKDSLNSTGTGQLLLIDTSNNRLARVINSFQLGNLGFAGQDSISLINSSGRAVIKKEGSSFVINNGNYNALDRQIDISNDNTSGTLGIYNSTVRAKRFYVNGLNYYIGGSELQVNGSQVIGGAGTNYFAPTNGLTVWGKTLIGTNTDANNGQLQVTGGISATSRYTGTSLKLNKDSVAFATSASKLMLIDTVTGLATKANIGTGLSLNSGTLSATTSVFGGSVSTPVTAVTTFQIYPPTQANANYQVVVTANNALTAGTMYYVNNKTTANFEVVFLSPITGTVAFDWILKP